MTSNHFSNADSLIYQTEKTISEAGDQFNASNMNDLEQRVKDGFDGLNASNS